MKLHYNSPNMSLSLESIQNRTFEVPKTLELPIIDLENPHKYFPHPIFPKMEIKFDYKLDLKAAGYTEVFICVTQDYAINHYFILWHLSTGQKFWCQMRSYTPMPPVWDRHFTFGPDYIDWLQIQERSKLLLELAGLPTIEIDERKENKTVFTVHEGKNLCLKAEAVEVKKVA